MTNIDLRGPPLLKYKMDLDLLVMDLCSYHWPPRSDSVSHITVIKTGLFFQSHCL